MKKRRSDDDDVEGLFLGAWDGPPTGAGILAPVKNTSKTQPQPKAPKQPSTDLADAAAGAAKLARRMTDWANLTAERDMPSALAASVAISNLLNAAAAAQIVANGGDPRLAAALMKPSTR